MREKAIALILTGILSVMLVGCGTGDGLIGKNKNDMVIQTNVTMEESNINAMIGGQIEEILVEEGEAVTAGQALIVINSDTMQAQKEQTLANIEQVKANIAAAQAAYQSVTKGATQEELNQLRASVDIAQVNIDNAQTAYDEAQKSYDRVKMLYDTGAAPKTDLESVENALTSTKNNLQNANSNYEIAKNKLASAQKGATEDDIARAKAGVDQAEAGLKQAEAGLKELETNIEKCTLKAPIDGVVTAVNVKIGDLVSSGLPTVVVTDINHPYLTCNIDEVDLSKVTLHQDVTITLAAAGDAEFAGKVVKINKNADFATKKASNDNGDFDVLTYGVKVEFSDAASVQDVLRAGMTAFVDFEG